MFEYFDNYLKKIPEDFELLLKALGHKSRLNLILLLMECKALSLSKIVKYTKQENSLALNHIKKLELAGMIQNYLKKSKESKEFSFYRITKYGTAIFSRLIETYNNYYKFFLNKINNIQFNYQEEIPEDFELALKAISNKLRYALTILILEKGSFTFSEIKKFLDKESSNVRHHLKILETSGILQNYLKKSEKSSEYSYYKITHYGKTLVEGLLTSYNDYYKGIIQEEDIFESRAEKIEIPYFDMGCNSWALPNESILGWIEIFSDDVAKIEMEFSEYLRIKEIFNRDYNYNGDANIYSIIIEKGKVNYIPFEFYSKIPKNEIHINLEHIKITVYDDDNNLLKERELSVEILRPLVKLEVTNKQKSPNSGFFEIKILCQRDLDIKILDIEIKVTDINDNPIEIKTSQMDPLELEQEIPPEIQLENLIGKFRLQGKGVFKFHFRVPYLDPNNNKHYSNVEIIELENIEEFAANLNYIYNYSTEMATI